MGEQQKVNQTKQDLSHVPKTRREKLAEPQAAGKGPFQITKYNMTVHSMDVKDNYQQWEGRETVVVGRMAFKHVMGKASFCNVQDLQGTIQVHVARDSIGEEPYRDFKKMGIGDTVGVRGTVFAAKTDEILIHAAEVTLLTKSLQVLPGRFHGLIDTGTRYHQRYMDLIMNAEVKGTFIKRSRIASTVRTYLNGQGLMEVETPMLVANAGGTVARPFETHFNALDEDLEMCISLKLYLKGLIVGGLKKVYEVDRVFRNEGLDTRHNPEFTLMELYQAYTDYNGMMELTEDLYRHVAQVVLGTTTITYKGMGMDLGRPFARITTVEAIKKYTGMDFDEIHALEEARAIAKEKGVELETRRKKGDILNLFFEESAEEHLVQPTFVLGHSVKISPLTKKKPGGPDYVERFEFFMSGWEVASAYSRINNPIDQRERFKAREELLAQGDEEANHMDEDFLDALEVGTSPAGGIGLDISRMVMLLADLPTIRDVLLFPTIKTIGSGEPSKKAERIDAIVELSAKTGETAAPIDFSKAKIEPLFEEMMGFETFAKSDYRTVKIKDCVVVPKNKRFLQFTSDDGSRTDRTILSGICECYEPEQLIGKIAVAIVSLPPRRMMGIDSYGMLVSAVHEKDGHEGLNLLMVDNRIPVDTKLY